MIPHMLRGEFMYEGEEIRTGQLRERRDDLKRTVWQLRAAKVRQCCSEITARSDGA